MQQIVDIFSKLNLAQKAIALIVLMAVVGVIFFYMVYSPNLESLKKLKKTEAELTEKLMENRAIAKNKDRFREELAVLDEELKQALTLLPNDKDIKALLRQLSILQKKTNVTNLLFKPNAEATKGFYAEIPIQLRLEGTYHDVALFFDKIGKLERIVNINDIELSAPKTDNGQVILTVGCTATTFQFTGGGGGAAAPAAAPENRG